MQCFRTEWVDFSVYLSKGTNGIKQAAVLILQDAHHPILMEELDALKRNVTDKLPKDDNILWGGCKLEERSG